MNNYNVSELSNIIGLTFPSPRSSRTWILVIFCAWIEK